MDELFGDPEWEDPYLTDPDGLYPGMIPDYPTFDDSIDVIGEDPGGEDGWIYDSPEGLPEDIHDDGGNWWDALKNITFGDDKSSPRSDIMRAAGLGALGKLLESLFARPLFQERTGFKGAASPQAMLEQQIGGLSSFGQQLQNRIVQGGGPMGPMPGMQPMPWGQPQGGGDEVEQILTSLMDEPQAQGGGPGGAFNRAP